MPLDCARGDKECKLSTYFFLSSGVVTPSAVEGQFIYFSHTILVQYLK